jgi:outer membrane protein insertion porin family
VELEKRFKSRWRRGVALRLENVKVKELDDDAPQEIIDVKGGNLLGGVRLGISKDMTNDVFLPSKGYVFDTGYEQVAGDHTFGILGATYRWYETVREDLAEQKTVLAAKIYGATTVGDAPPFEKFYAGGQGSLRGFDYRGISTRGLQTHVANPRRKDPVGSDWIFLANTELTVPLVSEKFAGLLFIDSGTIDSGTYRISAGAGIQIVMPQWFGPVPMRFELGFPILKDDDDETQAFSFSVGRLF